MERRMDVHVRAGYRAEVPAGLFSVGIPPQLHQKRALTKLMYPHSDRQHCFKPKYPILVPNDDSSDAHNLISIIISGMNLNVTAVVFNCAANWSLKERNKLWHKYLNRCTGVTLFFQINFSL